MSIRFKVCGIRLPTQAQTLSTEVDMLGFIYYPKSPRSLTEAPETTGVNRVGVFVNETIEHVLSIAQRDQLNFVQLHGDESPEYCRTIRESINVIKAFGVDSSFNFERLHAYAKVVDLFLFDTKTSEYGGSGIRFDWSVLNKYQDPTPFILSGGIDSNGASMIKNLKHPRLYGIDINSKFELAPGNKDINTVKKFIHELRD